MNDRIIAHVDFDAFFASVEERDKPYLKGLPIAVGADPEGGKGRGVVATASYAARAYGIRSATPIREAWRLSEKARAEGKPACVFITPVFNKYGAVSEQAFSAIRNLFPLVEQVSVDEGYVDITSCGSYKAAQKKMKALQAVIQKTCGLSLSIGIAPNKLMAKLACGLHKPQGFTVVEPDDVAHTLLAVPLKDIPGIGPKTLARLTAYGVKTVAHARMLDWNMLRKLFGTHGFDMYERLRGIDERPVVTEHAPQLSIGKHHTFPVDMHDFRDVYAQLEYQAGRIMVKLGQEGYTGFKRVVLTVRYEDFATYDASVSFDEPRTDKETLERSALKLLLPCFESKRNPDKKAVRLIGLRVERLS
jgi:nucleotidyltransferase/DNA polymerase involved in DNA repair